MLQQKNQINYHFKTSSSGGVWYNFQKVSCFREYFELKCTEFRMLLKPKDQMFSFNKPTMSVHFAQIFSA